MFHFYFSVRFSLCFQRKIVILHSKNKKRIYIMIDSPTIAKIMDATKIEEVVSEFVTLKKRALSDS